MSNPFEWVNAINNKTTIEADIQEYNPFLINRGLSYFYDTELCANQMNINNTLDKQLQYDFLYGIVPKKRRFAKWAKADENLDVELVAEYYKVNRRRAKEILNLLNPEQLQLVREKMFKGGK